MKATLQRWHDAWHRRWPGHVQRRFRHSLRWRLVALFLLLALGSTLLFVGGTQRLVASGFGLFVKPLLADYVDRLAAEIGSPPDVRRAAALAERLPIAIRIDGPRLRWTSPGESKWRDDRALLTRNTADGHRIQFGINAELWRQDGRWRGLVPVLGLIALTALAYAVVRRLLRPLDDIRAGALRYEGGDFSQPIPLARRDELGDLAGQVNAMAAGLQGMLKGQRELLLALSHELRSPLTRARLHAELLGDGAERAALLRELEAMRELLAGLLEGERLAAGPAALQREPCDLNTLLREVLAAQFAGAPLELDLAEPLPPLALDRVRVQLLLRNLVDNALRHGGAKADAPVQVSTALEGDAVRLRVRDHGPGVDEATRARLAEPFYRPEGARTRAGGGVGLGLYLCRRVAESHGARFTLADAAPGLAVEVAWPV